VARERPATPREREGAPLKLKLVEDTVVDGY